MKKTFSINDIKKRDNEIFQIFLENYDGGFDILFYKNNIIFMNDYNETLSIINENGKVWNRWKNLLASEYEN